MATAGGWELVTAIDDENPVVGDLRIRGTRIAKIATFGDAVAQQVRVHVRTLLGEWFLDRRMGVPYLQELFVKGVTERTVRAIMRRKILEVDGVARVLSLTVSVDRTTRLSTIDELVILTTEGDELALDDLTGAGF